MTYRCDLLSRMYSAPSASTVSRASSPGPDCASDSLYLAYLCLMQLYGVAGTQSGEVHSLLRAIFEQNSQILAQNADMSARLAEVEKVQQRSHMRIRPRSKCADGCAWSCPVCSQSQKHFDSFLSHVRKLAVSTVHRHHRAKLAKCRFHLDNHQHLLLVSRFPGDSDAAKAASFASHFLHVCRSSSASGFDAADKHKRIMEWLSRVTLDPSFSVAGECPAVSDTSPPTSLESSSSDHLHRNRVRL